MGDLEGAMILSEDEKTGILGKVRLLKEAHDLLRVEYDYDDSYGRVWPRSFFEELVVAAPDEDESETVSLRKCDVINSGKLWLQSRKDADGRTFMGRTLLWGYASMPGRGRDRIPGILNTSNPITKGLDKCLQCLESDGVESWMERLESAHNVWNDDCKIRNFGESFFTKVISFLSQVVADRRADDPPKFAAIKDEKTSQIAAWILPARRAALYPAGDARNQRTSRRYRLFSEVFEFSAQSVGLDVVGFEEKTFALAAGNPKLFKLE